MTERELERRAQRRLAVLRHVEEISGNVAATCRYYGISRNCYYKWLKRYEDEGFEGLKDRSSAPHRSPTNDGRCRRKVTGIQGHPSIPQIPSSHVQVSWRSESDSFP